MRKSSHIESLLPTVLVPKVCHRPIKQILQDLKQRKSIIKERIRTQLSDLQNEQRNEETISKDDIPIGISYSTNKRCQPRFLNSYESLNNLDRTYVHKSQSMNKFKTNRSSFKSQKRKQSSFVQIPTVKQKIISRPKKKTQSKILGNVMSKDLQSILVDVSLDLKDRTPDNVEFLKQYLIKKNIFMSKIHSEIVTCFLILNRLVWIQKDQPVFKAASQIKTFYIILLGKVKLYRKQKTGKITVKICLPGETIGEEVLFTNTHKKVALESARSLTKSFLVEIRMDTYQKMFQQLTKLGYRVPFNEMQNIIKRNYITKNWFRSEESRLDL